MYWAGFHGGCKPMLYEDEKELDVCEPKMTGGNEKAAGKKDGGPILTAQVPVGWQRKVEHGTVVYISPSGSVLCSVEAVRAYLLTDGTCKCGLECPLVLHKVFNFDSTAVVQAPSHQSGKVDEDMTKLCNHRRKVVAMAALCRSIQASQIPITPHATGNVACSVDDKDQRGSVATHGDVGQCTYPPHLNLNQARPSSSSSFPLPSPLALTPNGSLSHPDLNSPIKKPLSPAPSIAAYGKQQWSPRPAMSPNVLQRALHKPPSPSTTKAETQTFQADSSLPITFPSVSCSSPVTVRTGQPLPQGTAVKSPSPLFLCSSPLSAQDTSPHQRSRHSSTSSLSEGPPAILNQGVKHSTSPVPPPQVCSSPRLPVPSTSPHSRLDGILQHYKECSTTNPNSSQHQLTLNIQSKPHTLQNQQPTHNSPCDRRNGPAQGSASAQGLMGLPLGQMICQQKSQQHISSSFPASSLLSAAAKAQLANQKSQSQSDSTVLSLTGQDKEQQSKVLISTLNSSLHAPAGRPQSLTAFLLPPSPSHPASAPALSEKTLRRKRQRRSPTVLTMLKESQMSRTAGDLPASTLYIASTSPSSSVSPPPTPYAENNFSNARLPGTPSPFTFMPNNGLRQLEWEEGKRTALANSLSLSSPTASSQPLSALLQFISMQNTPQNIIHCNPTVLAPPTRHTGAPSSPSLVFSQNPQYDNQLAPQTHIHIKQSQTQSLVPLHDAITQLQSSQGLSLTCEDTEGVAMNLKTTQPYSEVLNLSQSQSGASEGPQSSVSSQTLGELSQLSPVSCLPASANPEKTCGSEKEEKGPEQTLYPSNHPNHNPAAESEDFVMSGEQQTLETALLSGCDADSNLTLPPAPCTPSSELSGSAADPTNTLQLAESFPFMTQEQLLQLLSSNAALPSLLPPFLGSLPLSLWTGGQTPTSGSTQPPQSTNHLLNQPSSLSVLPSTLGTHGDLPLNIISLLNPPSSGSPLTPGVASGLEVGEKNPGLQALLMASLLLGQNPAAMLPIPGLNVELPPLQQVFGEGASLEKTPALLDSLLMGPGLLEALQALTPSADGNSLLLSAQLTPPPPPPPAFLSLNPALLAAALAQTETLPNHTPSPPPQTQGTLSSPGLVSTSVSCAPLVPVTGQEVCDSLTEQEKSNTQTPHFLPTILPQAVLGDLAALGNINSLHGLLAAGPLLLSQSPSLGISLPQNQAALSPLTCLQLSVAPTLIGEKPLAEQESTSAPEELPPSQDSLLNPGHLQSPAQQRVESVGGQPGLIDPYGSFMNTIYTSFLQVSGRGSEVGSDANPLSYPELPSLSPRRAYSVHNPDLSRLSMEAAQSPARGTPKLSEDPPTSPPSKPAQSHPPDAPMHLTFMEEAKTDGSALHVYSNGIGSAAERDDDDEEERRQPQGGYMSPRERVNPDAVEDPVSSTDAQQNRGVEMCTAARRGRKRKQTLQRGADIPEDMDSIVEEPVDTTALQRPVRGRRRRVLR